MADRFLGFRIASGSSHAQEKGWEPRNVEKPSRLGTAVGWTAIGTCVLSLGLVFNQIVESGEGHGPIYMSTEELERSKHIISVDSEDGQPGGHAPVLD